MKYSTLIIAAILIAQIGAAQSIQGIVFDKETGEQLPFANVILFEDSVQIEGVTTSLEGEYSFDDIAPGTYEMEAVYVGYPNHRISKVEVVGGIVKVDIRMELDENGVSLGENTYITWCGRLIQIDETLNGETLPKANQGIIQGKVFDKEMNEGLPFANVILLQKGIQKAGTTTDLDGNYNFVITESGEYDVEAVYVGYPNKRITGILVKEDLIPLDIEMKQGEGEHWLEVRIISVNIPIIRMDKTSTGATWEAYEIKRFPGF